MKTKFLGVFLMMWAMIGLEAGAQHTANAKKVLVAYFSWSGNTRNLAHQIQELTGGDLFEIETVKAYPEMDETRPASVTRKNIQKRRNEQQS